MRYVDRSAVAPPASLSEKNCAGKKEYEKAKKYYAKTALGEKAFPFSTYKGDDVKEALRNLFNGKCAYCEIRFEGSQPVDIEHYRPKGGVQEKQDHRGYWWLAATWSNLLPSCIDCNRRRRQVSAPLGMTLAELEAAIARIGNPEPGGKHDAFPTLYNVWANEDEDPDAVEQPSLIDPTRTDPKNHLVWPQAEVSVVLPQLDEHGNECPRAVASIHIYALNRLGLVQSRLEVRQDLEAHLQTIRSTAAIAMGLPAENRASFIRIIEEAIINIRRQITSAHHAFSAMLEAHLFEFEKELIKIIENN